MHQVAFLKIQCTTLVVWVAMPLAVVSHHVDQQRLNELLC
jgi:hypothetical protein